MRNHRESGQAIFEYILLLAIVISTFLVVRVGFGSLRSQLFGKMCRDVVAACPGCPPPDGGCP